MLNACKFLSWVAIRCLTDNGYEICYNVEVCSSCIDCMLSIGI